MQSKRSLHFRPRGNTSVLATWMADLGGIMLSQTLQGIDLILIPSIARDKIVRMGLFSRRGSTCSARAGVAARGKFMGQKMERN